MGGYLFMYLMPIIYYFNILKSIYICCIETLFHGISIISKTMLYRVDVLGEGMEQRKDRLQAGLERVGIHSPAKLLI